MLPFGTRNKIIELIYYYYDRCTGNSLLHNFLVVTLVFLLKGLLGNHICFFIMSPWFYHLHLFLLPNEYISSGGIPVEQSGSLEHWLPNFCENRYQKCLFQIFYQIYYYLCKTFTRLQNNHWYHLIFSACSISSSLSTLPSTNDQTLHLIEK